MTYQVTVKPVSNIAFPEQFLEMCKSELTYVLKSYGVQVENIHVIASGKGHMVAFDTSEPLKDQVIKSIYGLSFFYMLYQVIEGGMIKAIHRAELLSCFGDDLSTRMKYNGKTNETITRMMMNLALAASDYPEEAHPKLLDPLCGRGTTLFEGMISGYDVYGVDRDQKGLAEMGVFITRYIKEGRFKHANKRGKLIQGGKHIGDLFELQYANDKVSYKKGDLRELKTLCGDTSDFDGAFRHNSMHLLVTDFPYNVQHKGKGNDGEKGLEWLLRNGLSHWDTFLKRGAGVAVSWNTYTDTREAFSKVFEDLGYEVIEENGLGGLGHRVAQAINRDIIIAKKK